MGFVEISDLGQVMVPRVQAEVRPISPGPGYTWDSQYNVWVAPGEPPPKSMPSLFPAAEKKMPKMIRWFVLGFSVLLGLTVLSQVLKKQTS